MQLLYQPEDPYLNETLQHIVNKATESPFAGGKWQVGTVTLNCTANTPTSQSVTFPNPFANGSTPYVKLGITSLGNPSSQVTPSAVNPTNKGFTAQVYSSVTQTVTLTYFAFGQVGR